ncbi:hypothetical protein ACFL56_03095 [Candidatus Margulisiibacteriota bacterium]
MKNYLKSKVNENFFKWSTEGYGGIVGGNKQARFWFCGIEWGKDDNFNKIPIVKDTNNYPKGFSSEDKNKKWFGSMDNIYGPISKIIVSTLEELNQLPKNELSYLEKARKYFKEKLFIENGDSFMMNLFPLPFAEDNDSHWRKLQNNLTGFDNKFLYRTFCRLYRFKYLKELFTEIKKPKTIVCCGLGYLRDYIDIFGSDNITDYKEEKLNKHTVISFIDGKSKIFITPFLSVRGIADDKSLEELGKILAEHLFKYQ